MKSLSLIPIHPEASKNQNFFENPDCAEFLELQLPFYDLIGFVQPWIGYFVEIKGTIVGACGFKGAPLEGKVEIAYGTFKAFRGKGVAKAMCKALTKLAAKIDPKVKITALTIPEENASCAILRSNGFVLKGEVLDIKDDMAWEWVHISS